MTISELEQQLLQLTPNEKLHIIQLLTQSLTTHSTHSEQPTTLVEFFSQSPLVEISEELDFSRDRSLPRDDFNP